MGEVVRRTGGDGAATPPVPTFGRSTLPIKGREELTLPSAIPSPHGRDDEMALGVDSLRPAGGDGLDLGVELHPLHAMLVGVAERTALPAAEGVVGHRHRNRHIDPDHADLDPTGELPPPRAVAAH